MNVLYGRQQLAVELGILLLWIFSRSSTACLPENVRQTIEAPVGFSCNFSVDVMACSGSCSTSQVRITNFIQNDCVICVHVFHFIWRFRTTSFRTSWVTTECVRTNEWNVARFVCLQQCVRLTSVVTSSSTFSTQSSVHVNSATTNTQTANTFITIRSMSWNKYTEPHKYLVKIQRNNYWIFLILLRVSI